MSNSKNYNSIVFLTTLSVYLGLVLVSGATPSVFAQAALTQKIEIQNEIEKEDDLDKNPDDESCSELGKIAEKQLKQFGFNKYVAIDFANLIKGSITDFVVTNNELISSKNRSGVIDFLLPKSKNGVSEEPSLKLKITPEKSFSSFSFTYTIETSADGYLLASAFDYGFKYENCRSKGNFEAVIYTNAEISHSNNQVFIVTRLPRASIDELLAETNAK